MTWWPRRRRFVALAGAASTVVLAGWYLVLVDLTPTDDLDLPATLTGAALALIVPGLVAEWQRPRDPVAWLVVVAGISTALAYFRLLERPWAASVGAAALFALPLVVCHVLLALPDRVERRTRRRVVAACWVAPALLAAGTLLVTGPRDTAEGLRSGGLRAASWAFTVWADEPTRWFRQANALHHVESDLAVRVLWGAWSVLVVGAGWATVVAVGRRRARASGAERRSAQLRFGSAVAVVAALMTLPLAAYPERARVVAGVPIDSVLQGRWYADIVIAAPALAAAVLGGALVWEELVRPRLARDAAGAIQLDVSGAPALLARQLQRALGDPTARILFPHEDGRWTDDAGRPVEPAAGSGRAATIVTRTGSPVAAVEHDESLLAQPDLLDVAVASVALTLDAGRLAALARASTDDVQTSARRLLGAAEDARRTVAQRIDDGPAQTLATVESLLREEPVRLDAVHAELRTAVAQIRDIARGVAPTTALEGGLRNALDDLAMGAEVPVAITGVPDTALPRVVEVTILLASRDAAEHATGPLALTVSVEGRHADAIERVVLGVDGWAGPLDQLVDDRIRTLGGRVEVDSASVTVTLPLGDE